MSEKNLYHYREKSPGKIYVITTVLIYFILCCLSYSWVPQFNAEESQIVMAANDFYHGEGLGRLVGADGHLTDYPLMSMVLAGIKHFVPLNPWFCRLPTALLLLFTVLYSSYTAARSAGHRAGFTTAALMFSMVLPILYANRLSNELPAGCLITLAWLMLYRNSRVRSRPWQRTWLVSIFFIWLATFAVGFRAMAIFYIPLLFLKRPIKMRARLVHWEHYVCLILYAIFFKMTWVLIFPDVQVQSAVLPEMLHQQTVPPGIITYWFEILIFSLPAAILAWPVFCVKFWGLERTPVYSSFLRTLIIVCFVLTSVYPRQLEALLALIGILAVACSLHYDLLIRRYYYRLHRVKSGLRKVLMVSSLSLLGLLGYHYTKGCPILESSTQLHHILLLGLAIFGIIVSVVLARRNGKGLFSSKLAYLCIVITLQTLATREILLMDDRDDKQDLALQLSSPRTGDNWIYNLSGRKHETIICYFPQRILNATSVDELPLDESIVVLTEGGKSPVLETRSWNMLSKVTLRNGKELSLWLGILTP